jgi:hypothetical protein
MIRLLAIKNIEFYEFTCFILTQIKNSGLILSRLTNNLQSIFVFSNIFKLESVMRILTLEEMELVSGGKGGSKRAKGHGGAKSGKAASNSCNAGSGSSGKCGCTGGGSSSSSNGGCTPPPPPPGGNG